MAKKVVTHTDGTETPEERDARLKGKRKHKKCCTCCLVFLIVSVVILATAFGIGWYFGDKYTKQYLDMSLGDSLGVVSDLYWTKDKDVVKNPYSDSDLDDFYSEIKKNLLLKEDANIDFDTALNNAMKSYLSSGDDADGAQTSALRKSAEGESDAQESSSSITDALVDMLVGVISRDNIDIERLKGYSEENDDYIFALKDKQLAAFVNAVLKAVFADVHNINAVKGYADAINFADIISLKQIRFKAESQENESGEEVVTATIADITVWMGLQSAAGQAITYYLNEGGYGWMSGIASWLGDVILPKNLYATVSIPLHGDAEPQVTLNDMNVAKRERAYKLVNGILSSSGSDKTIQSYLCDFGDKMKPYLEVAAGKMDFSSAAQGTIKLDLIDSMVKMANKSIGGEEPLTKPDFMYMLQALLASDADARLAEIEPYLYNDWYVDGSGAYHHDPLDKTGLTLVDYENEFVKAIESTYFVNFGENAKLKDVLSMLGISLDGSSSGSSDSSDLIDNINAARLHASLDKPESELKLRITDRMLAAALGSQLNALLTDGDSEFNGLTVVLDALTFVEAENSDGHTYALLAVEVKFDELLASLDNGILSKIAASILPEKILLSITVDVTLSPSAGFVYAPASYMLNDCRNTDNVIDTLGKLIPSLDFGSMTGEIEKMLRDMLKELDKTLDIELVTSKVTAQKVENGQLVLPSIFEFVANQVLVDDDGQPIVKSSELISVLKGLDDTSGFSDTKLIADNYSVFMADVIDKYYLAPTAANPVDTFEDLTDFIGADGFDASKFRMSGTDPDGKYLIYDTRDVDDLRPVMRARELGALMAKEITFGDGDIKKFTLLDVRTTPQSLTVIMSVEVDELMPDKVKSLLTAKYMYVTVTAKVTQAVNGAYPIELAINNMDGETLESALKIVKHFGDGFDLEDQIAEFGKILYEQINSLENSLGGEGFLKFTNDGIELAGFYEYLVNKLSLKSAEGGPAQPENAKAALQGMYAQSDIAELNNPLNYAMSGDMPTFILNYSTETAYPTGIQMSDIRFNGFFQTALVNNGLASSVTTMQTIALWHGDTSAAAKQVRDWLNPSLKTQLNSDKDYFVVTFRMDINKNTDDGEPDASNGFMPDYVYVTVALEQQSDGTYEHFGFAMNNMSSAARNIIMQIMNVSEDASDNGKINIASVVSASVGELNDLIEQGGSVNIGAQFGGEGVGSVIFGISV